MKRSVHLILVMLMVSVIFVFSAVTLSHQASAKQDYTVKPGDSLWLIAVRYQIGLSEIIEANPQIENPHWIYPGQRINIPDLDQVKIIEHDVIRMVNIERSKAGLEVLRPNWELSRVARHKARDMRDKAYFSHTSPTYGSPFDMMRAYGLRFTAAGENIASGQATPEQVMKAWMNSKDHRANIMNAKFEQIGVGYARGGSGRYYWTQMFMSR